MVTKVLRIALSTLLAGSLITGMSLPGSPGGAGLGAPAWAAPADSDSDTGRTGSSPKDLPKELDLNFDAFSKPIEDRPHYVAIGDSYSVSGFGPVTLWEPCFRNLTDYPHLTALGTTLPLVEPACIGGSGSGYWYSSRIKGTDVAVKVPYRQLINKQSALVTINLGLNDIMLAYDGRYLKQCFAAMIHNDDRANTSACKEAVGKDIAPLLKLLPRVLEGIYKDAKQRAGKDSLVIAVGYVSFFYEDKFCWDNLTIGPADRAYINSIFNSVNRAVKKAAKKAKVPYYIPADNQSYLTSTCGIPGLRWTSTTGLPEVTYPLHPTPAANAATAFHISQMYREHQIALATKQAK